MTVETRVPCLDTLQVLLQERGNEGPPALYDMVILWGGQTETGQLGLLGFNELTGQGRGTSNH